MGKIDEADVRDAVLWGMLIGACLVHRPSREAIAGKVNADYLPKAAGIGGHMSGLLHALLNETGDREHDRTVLGDSLEGLGVKVVKDQTLFDAILAKLAGMQLRAATERKLLHCTNFVKGGMTEEAIRLLRKFVSDLDKGVPPESEPEIR